MIFVSEAGSTRMLALCCATTCPLLKSLSKYALTAKLGGGAICAAPACAKFVKEVIAKVMAKEELVIMRVKLYFLMICMRFNGWVY